MSIFIYGFRGGCAFQNAEKLSQCGALSVSPVPQKITSQHGSPSDMETKPFNHITLL